MKARITDLTTFKSYVVTCEDDCRDGVDLSAYQSAVKLNSAIGMGCVVVEPLKD